MKQLRQLKNTQKNRLTKKYQLNRSKAKRILDDMVAKYKDVKNWEYLEADKKIKLYKERADVENSVRRAPQHTGEILSGVNVFLADQQDVTPQDPLGPFVDLSSECIYASETLPDGKN